MKIKNTNVQCLYQNVIYGILTNKNQSYGIPLLYWYNKNV